MSDPLLPADARAWIDAFAARLGVTPPDDHEVATLLELAGVAAHGSHRMAAPLACWLVGRAGVGVDEAHRHATAVAG